MENRPNERAATTGDRQPHKDVRPQFGARATVLAVGAHPDDIELGCAATLRAHVSAGHRVIMLVMTDGERGPGAHAARRHREQVRAARCIGAELRWAGLSDGDLGADHTAVRVIEDVLRDTGATVVYTHAPDDSHQDHRATSTAVESAARNVPNLLFFEGPSTIHFAPDIFVSAAGFVDDKLAALTAHASQVAGSERVNLECVRALLKVRGFQARVDYAEAFRGRRYVMSPAHHVVTHPAVEHRLQPVRGTALV